MHIFPIPELFLLCLLDGLKLSWELRYKIFQLFTDAISFYS